MLTKFKLFEQTLNQKFEIPEQIRKYYIIEGDMSNSKNWKTTKYFQTSYDKNKKEEEQEKLIGYVLISLDSNHIIPICRNDEHKVEYDVLWNVYYPKYKVPEENYISIAASSNFSCHYIYHIDDPKEKEEQMAAFRKFLEYGGSPKHKIHFLATEESKRNDYEMTVEEFLETGGSYKEFKTKIVKSGKLSTNGEMLIGKLEQLAKLWTDYIFAERDVNERRMNYIKNQFLPLCEELTYFIWKNYRLSKFLEDISSKFSKKINEFVENQNMNGLGDVLFSHNGLKNYVHIKLKDPNNKEVKDFFWNVKKAIMEFDRLSSI